MTQLDLLADATAKPKAKPRKRRTKPQVAANAQPTVDQNNN